MASPSFLGCPLKLNDAGGRSLSSVLSDKCTVNRITRRNPDPPAIWGRAAPRDPCREGEKGQDGRMKKRAHDRTDEAVATWTVGEMSSLPGRMEMKEPGQTETWGGGSQDEKDADNSLIQH